MNDLIEVAQHLMGPLAVIGLLSLSGVLAAGRHRRRQWMARVLVLDAVPGEGGIRDAQESQRASDFLNDSFRALYYVITLGSAFGLTTLPYLSLEASARWRVWAGLNIVTALGALSLLVHWHGWDDEREVVLRRQLRDVQEHALERRGLKVRDSLTGVYSLDYWVHVLELEASPRLRRPPPVTCLMFQVTGLPQAQALRGQAVADEILKRATHEISLNVRRRDIVCRSAPDRITVALLRCPSQFAPRVADRVSSNVTRLALTGFQARLALALRLEWAHATMPGDGRTSIELLRITERRLDDTGGVAVANLAESGDHEIRA